MHRHIVQSLLSLVEDHGFFSFAAYEPESPGSTVLVGSLLGRPSSVEGRRRSQACKHTELPTTCLRNSHAACEMPRYDVCSVAEYAAQDGSHWRPWRRRGAAAAERAANRTGVVARLRGGTAAHTPHQAQRRQPAVLSSLCQRYGFPLPRRALLPTSAKLQYEMKEPEAAPGRPGAGLLG